MKLGYVIYYVSSVEDTIRFYEKAFSMKRKFIHESGEYGELDTGPTTLSFASLNMGEMNDVGFKKREPGFQSSDMEIALVSDDIALAHARALEAGAIEVKRPEMKPWGQVVSYVRDLNGFLVEICSPIS